MSHWIMWLVLCMAFVVSPGLAKENAGEARVSIHRMQPSAPVSGGETVIIQVKEVTDGHTLKASNDRVIRLWGIKGPVPGEFGFFQAKILLEALIGPEKTVRCVVKDAGQEIQVIMQCFVGSQDLGAMLVSTGWMFDHPFYSDHYYRHEEHVAKAARRGLWGQRRNAE